MSSIENILNKRIQRLNLDVTKSYQMIQMIDNMQKELYVGKFVKAYRMGSGDGMTAHWEFNDNGKINRVDDQMWGSLNGNELVGFTQID